MNKKCIICDKNAEFLIKGTNDYYCKDCAEDAFSDLSYLEKMENSEKK